MVYIVISLELFWVSKINLSWLKPLFRSKLRCCSFDTVVYLFSVDFVCHIALPSFHLSLS